MTIRKIADHGAYLIGKNTRETVEQLGSICVFLWKIVLAIPATRKNFHVTMEQMMLIGISSLPIVMVTSIFTGAVTSAQAAYQFSDYVLLAYLGMAVGKAVMVKPLL